MWNEDTAKRLAADLLDDPQDQKVKKLVGQSLTLLFRQLEIEQKDLLPLYEKAGLKPPSTGNVSDLLGGKLNMRVGTLIRLLMAMGFEFCDFQMALEEAVELTHRPRRAQLTPDQRLEFRRSELRALQDPRFRRAFAEDLDVSGLELLRKLLERVDLLEAKVESMGGRKTAEEKP